jgi:hypothetical protein
VDLDEYIEISGLAVKDTQRAFVTANIKKAQYTIESALGFTLDAEKAAQNLYTETGKAPSDNWICGGSDADLLPADDEPDAQYRLFDDGNETASWPWGHRGSLIRIDPCTAVTKVKLVHGSVTLHTYEADEVALLKSGEYGRILDVVTVFPYLDYHRSCRHRLQVAVWADWLGVDKDNQPDDLLSVWADLATSLSDKTRNIKSENRGTRSYTKFAPVSSIDDPINRVILAQYAGPRGTAGRLPV